MRSDDGETASDDDTVEAALREWRQGDIVVGLGDFTVRALDASDGEAFDAPIPSTEAVIMSQTCDVVRHPSDVPNVEVAILVRLPEPDATEARKHRRPAYIHVPGGGPDAFAYPNVSMCVDKRALIKLKRSLGCRTESETRSFAEGLCRRLSRFAFPDDVHGVLSALRKQLQRRAGKGSNEGRAVDLVQDVFASAEPSWQASGRKLTLHFVVEEAAEDADVELVQRCAGEWERKCRDDKDIVAFVVDVCRLTEISAALYLTWARVDFDGISPT